MVDRVATTSTTWLGLTMRCAQCHTHKFDPITHREYYQFMALLDNADEPSLDLPTPEITAQRAQRQKRIDAAHGRVAGEVSKVAGKLRVPSASDGHSKQLAPRKHTLPLPSATHTRVCVLLWTRLRQMARRLAQARRRAGRSFAR